MDNTLVVCWRNVSIGLAEIKDFDRNIASGHLDSASSQLLTLWRRLSKPTEILTNCYEGEFWRDWPGKCVFESNLKEVWELLNTFEDEETVDTLEEVRDYMHANFSLLSDAITTMCADIGIDGHKNLILEDTF